MKLDQNSIIGIVRFSRFALVACMRTIFAWIVATILGFSPIAAQEIPITGMPVADLADFDQLMSEFMEDNDIEAGLLGIMRNGVIVYQRGFGWKDEENTEHLRHDALMRIASVNKPFTAAAAQKLIAGEELARNDFAFEVSTNGGILRTVDYDPFPGLGDTRYADITVQHLYTHCGGWDRNRPTGSPADPDDHTYKEIQIADDFNDAEDPTDYPPGRVKTIRWIMGQPLDFDPILPPSPIWRREYSNVGFLVLGKIVEQESGTDLISYVRDTVLGPLEWVPVTELVLGGTFPWWRDWREPWYDCEPMSPNVFDADPERDDVIRSDGGWHHEARVGQGGMVSSTTVMLHLAENYYISDLFVSDPTYGEPTGGVRQNRFHHGDLCGTNSVLQQRNDGINFAVIFNKLGDDVNKLPAQIHYNEAIRRDINNKIGTPGITWPTQGVDGQWADFSEASSGLGSFEDPWGFFSQALVLMADEGTLNIKPSTSNWTGTINQRVRIRAPLGGVVRIGQQ